MSVEVEGVEEESMMLKIEEFVLKHKLSSEGKREMLSLLNESLIVISEGILKSKSLVEKVEKVEKKSEKKEYKKYKSKKAELYAEENGIEIEEFKMSLISKKDVEDLVREKSKKLMKINVEKVKKVEKEEKEEKEEKKEVKKVRVICSGINKKGEACKSTGTIQPEGSKKKYCFRHAEDWKSFECSSDSSEDENEDEEVKKEKENEEEVKKEEENEVKKDEEENKEEQEEKEEELKEEKYD